MIEIALVFFTAASVLFGLNWGEKQRRPTHTQQSLSPKAADAWVPGYRIGTVDKFQGKQAPVVIYSMATSSAEDAPRGMEFLFSLNRLNVATSRAQAVVAVVASPDLGLAHCRSPRQMKLANAFCAYLEAASFGESQAGTPSEATRTGDP
jgi:hypothetical protein